MSVPLVDILQVGSAPLKARDEGANQVRLLGGSLDGVPITVPRQCWIGRFTIRSPALRAPADMANVIAIITTKDDLCPRS